MPYGTMLKLRHFLTVGLGTSVSRVLGFIRDIAIAAALGAGPVADSFVVAFRLPNLFRRVFTEGAFNSAFIPAYNRRRAEDGQAAADRFSDQVLSITTLAAILMVTVLIVGSGWVVAVLAPGFETDPARFTLAQNLMRVALPYLPLTLAFAVMAAVLNAHNRFGAMAFAPNLMNVVMIAAVLPFTTLANQGSAMAGWALAMAVTVGGLIQLVIVARAIRKAGLTIRLVRPRWTREMALVFARAFSGVLASSIVQINMLVATVVASLAPSAVSWLYYADRVYQLPLGIVSVAIGVVLLPAITDKMREGAHADVNQALSQALELAWMLTIPAAVGLYMLAQPIADVLFQRGAFSHADARATAQLLALLGLSLPALVAIKVFNAAFFAREDTFTPMMSAVGCIVFNGVLGLMLFRLYGPVGIALALTLSSWLSSMLLFALILRTTGFTPPAQIFWRLGAIAVATGAMAATLWCLAPLLEPWLQARGLMRAVSLLALIIAALAVYGGMIFLSGATTLSRLTSMIRRAR